MDSVQERAEIYIRARREEIRAALAQLPDGPELREVEELLEEMGRIVTPPCGNSGSVV